MGILFSAFSRRGVKSYILHCCLFRSKMNSLFCSVGQRSGRSGRDGCKIKMLMIAVPESNLAGSVGLSKRISLQQYFFNTS